MELDENDSPILVVESGTNPTASRPSCSLSPFSYASIYVLLVSAVCMVVAAFRFHLVPIHDNYMIGISPKSFVDAGMLNWKQQHGLSLVSAHSLCHA